MCLIQCTVKIKSIGTEKSEHKVQTLIRLFLSTVFHSMYMFWKQFLSWKKTLILLANKYGSFYILGCLFLLIIKYFGIYKRRPNLNACIQHFFCQTVTVHINILGVPIFIIITVF